MDRSIIESAYPIDFHKDEASLLGQQLKNRQSVVLLGMKRVGISNFLRFFLYHKDIAKTYIADNKKHLFIPVDLNDLVEKEIYPFWTLTLKRIADAAEASALPPTVKKTIEESFLHSIQTQDLFLTIDAVRKSLLSIVDNGYLPTIFFVLFDRMKDAVTPEFFANLQGVRDATHQKLAYVFTSFRSLDALDPKVFPKSSLVVFSHDMYIKPVKHEDANTIYATYLEKYGLKVVAATKEYLFALVDGYVRYLHLALIFLNEHQKSRFASKEQLFDALIRDERVGLQSEELWESLQAHEQNVLKKVLWGAEITSTEKTSAKYLWDTGFINEGNKIFSPLFAHYVAGQTEKAAGDNHVIELTKKEHMLYDLLKSNMNVVCEREKIAESVWPEVEEFGVSDWAIDRLVARVRSKLKLQKSGFEIQTVKTRGYKLIAIE